MCMDRIDIEMLRTIAAADGLPFAHACTAALAGEPWALDRAREVQERLVREPDVDVLEILRQADATRPDGAVARSIDL